MLRSMHWKVLDHAPYSLDLSPCDFHVFSPLKKVLKGHRFRSGEDIKAVVVQWFQQQPREFLDGIHQLMCQWDACLNAHEDYF
jgi:histone-lysine N-methyltransferase SETMAR